jgi:hypothetical protein
MSNINDSTNFRELFGEGYISPYKVKLLYNPLKSLYSFLKVFLISQIPSIQLLQSSWLQVKIKSHDKVSCVPYL